MIVPSGRVLQKTIGDSSTGRVQFINCHFGQKFPRVMLGSSRDIVTLRNHMGKGLETSGEWRSSTPT